MQKRSPSSRRHPRRHRKNGSIMIMVVALLVLMALIGTAYIATSRIDRGSASQNADNVQIDLLVQSVLNMCKTSVAGDAFDGNNNYRAYPRDPFDTNVNNNTIPVGYLPDTFFYYNITSTLDDQKLAGGGVQRIDYWLADRTPSFGPTQADPTPHYFWNRISLPLTTETGVSGTNPAPIRSFFEDPTYVRQNASDPLVFQFNNHDRLEPTFVLVNGVPMPAFFVNTGISGYNKVLAADADGDGIADGFLCRLPIGTVNGLTYYYSVRIIDNAAAINLNTAWGNKVKMASGTADGNRLFPSSIQLDPTNNNGGPDLFSKPEVNSIHAYRTRSGTGPADPPVLGTQPWDDNRIKRPDFVFLGDHDAFWMQLGRRPENPGWTPDANNPVRYRSFPLSDEISLVPHFVLAPISSTSIIDTTLYVDFGLNNSLSARNKPYSPSDLAVWGDDNFNYTPGNSIYNRRALVVTTNAVSTATSPRYMPKTFRDTNEDGIFGNDVPTRDMLFYSVSENGDRNGLNYANTGIFYHLEKYDLTQTTWATGSSAHQPGDYIQVTIPGPSLSAPPSVLNFVYARSAATATPSPVDPSTTNPGSNYWEFIPTMPTGTPMKTSLNTAGFRELYRSYWNVMSNDNAADVTPYGNPKNGTESTNFTSPYDIPHPHKQFRSSLRDTHGAFMAPGPNGDPPGYQGYRFEPFQQLLLRAAIAAVNTIDLRDNDDDVTSRTIVLKYRNMSKELKPVEVTIYGYEPQPFITEIYANANSVTDSTGDPVNGLRNKKGYVAIELFNPYDKAFNLQGWKLGLINRRRDRKSTTGEDRYQMREIVMSRPFTTADVVPAGGYFVLENFKDPADPTSTIDPAQYRPSKIPDLKLSLGARRRYVPELGKVFQDDGSTPKELGGELVLMRPRRADKQTKASNRPYDAYNETASNTNAILDYVPVDSFDFTGLKVKASPVTTDVDVHIWHYVRESDSTSARWKCVYGGRYFGNKNNMAGVDPEEPRQDATDKKLTITATKDPNFDDTVTPAVTLGFSNPVSSFKDSPKNFLPIQLNNKDFAGPFRDLKQTGNTFPFGGFMRAGDVMQVPFIGAYRVRELEVVNSTGSDPKPNPNGFGYALKYPVDTFLELNSISMDSAFADDSQDGNEQYENLGRFCPLPPAAQNPTNYDFARKIFDYFTVIAPNEDYLPNINPDRTPDPNKGNSSLYRFGNTSIRGSDATGYPKPHADQVKQIDSPTNSSGTEEITGVPGQLNVNTANQKVLSAVPFTNDPAVNAAIAKAIVDYRDGNPISPTPVHNPYRSLFDLYNVTGFVNNQPIGTDPDDDEGDFSPAGSGTDGVTDDAEFEKQFLLINRISNLLTTRSDSFTAYVLVQGWRNANTPQAELVVQRRAAMLIDRSGVTPKNREPRSMLIPVE